MSTLTGRTIASSYKDLLQVSNSNAGVDATLRAVEDGEGTSSALFVSTTGISVPGAGANSEAFGSGATTGTSGSNTAIGNGASAAASSGNQVAVGKSATCNAAQATAVGSSSTAGVYGVSVGYLATTSAAQFGCAIGQNSNCGHNHAIALGAGAVTTAANQLMVGQPTSGSGAYITQVKFPNTTSGAGTTVTIAGSDAGSGNSNGGDITLTPGLKAGSGADGNVTLSRGRLVLPAAVAPALAGSVDVTYGFGPYFSAGSQWAAFVAGTAVVGWFSNAAIAMNLKSDYYITWSDNVVGNGVDLRLGRSAAGVLLISSTASTLGRTLTGVLVEANTAGSGSPNILTAIESRTVLTNEGTTAENYHTLPTAAAGLDFEFVCQDSDGIRVVASAGDTIRDVATVSATAGYIRSSTIGSVIRLKAINATEWFVVYKQGTWTVDA